MENRCYCVHQAENYGENHVILAIFLSKEKAEKFEQIEKGLNPYDSIWVSEETFKDDSFDMNTKITTYYNYHINVLAFTTLTALDAENKAWGSAEPSYWYADNYVEVYPDGDYIVGYSNESYDKAREIALDYYKRMKSGDMENCAYEILNRTR